MKKMYAIIEDRYGNIFLKREVKEWNLGFFYPVPMEGKHIYYLYEESKN